MNRLNFPRRTARWVTLSLVAACGGNDGTTPTPPANSVASVTVSPPTSTLIPSETVQLSATPKNAAGATVAGRTVMWTSSQNAVATVSNAGLVSAIAPGTATITATSEGKSGTAEVTVEPGVLVGPTGGTVTFDDGRVELTVPPGALATPTAITATRLAQPSAPPPPELQVVGPVYRLGPAGLTFAQPVTVKIRYDRKTLPVWAMAGDLSVQHGTGTGWTSLTDTVVDGQANTVSGKTSGFGASAAAAADRGRDAGNASAAVAEESEHAIMALNPHAVLTPGSGSVNSQHRTASFHVSLVPRGASIPSNPIEKPADNPGLYKYRWSTTGQNGVLDVGGTTTGWTTKADMGYIVTNPVVDQLHGQIDMITVEVLVNPAAENNPSPRDITRTSAPIDADLGVTYNLVPDAVTLGRGQTRDFELRVLDRNLNVVELPSNRTVLWSGIVNHGAINLTPEQTKVRYAAKSALSGPPPRVDQIKAQVGEFRRAEERESRYDEVTGRILDRTISVTVEWLGVIAEATGTVAVKVDYEVALQPAGSAIAPGATQQLRVFLEPDEIAPEFLVYKYVNTAREGTLDVANDAQTASSVVTYTASTLSDGGTDQVEVEVFSVIGGVVQQSLGKATVSVTVGNFDFIQVSNSALQHACGVTPAHRLYCWGSNFWGQLGDGTKVNRSHPTLVSGSQQWAQVAGGGRHTCALTTEGEAWCWGNRELPGLLGDGEAQQPKERLQPVRVQTGARFVSITAGDQHTCGVTAAGGLLCWGYQNWWAGAQFEPRVVTGAAGVAQADAGWVRTCFVTASGQLYCWGDNGVDPNDQVNGVDYQQPNGRGLLGTGSTAAWLVVPEPVLGFGATPSEPGGDLVAWSKVSSSTGFSCAVDVLNTAMCWGVNAFGQLGDGSTQWRGSVAPVANSLQFTDVQAGLWHACGLTVDGGIWCWGRGTEGQLGNGTNNSSPVPVLVAGPGPFAKLSVGRQTNCGSTVTGETWCWGLNTVGQVGDGTVTLRSVPVRVKP